VIGNSDYLQGFPNWTSVATQTVGYWRYFNWIGPDFLLQLATKETGYVQKGGISWKSLSIQSPSPGPRPTVWSFSDTFRPFSNRLAIGGQSCGNLWTVQSGRSAIGKLFTHSRFPLRNLLRTA